VAFCGARLLDGEEWILMLTGKQKIKYLFDSFLASGQKLRCTYCKSEDCKEIDRKWIVTRLMECQNCHLYFRYPVDRKEENEDFYQTAYQETDNITTDLPDGAALEKMKADRFHTGNKNGDRYLDLFTRLFPGEKSLRIIDYGCSWGYLTYQFKQAGHDVQGYEISRSRAAYGMENLDVEIKSDENDLRKDNHIFFSSHVIEHHPDIAAMIACAKSLLIPGGYFIAFCPNGSLPYRTKNQEAFHHAWGKVHPNYLNADFYQYVFRDQPYYIAASPVSREAVHPLQPQEKSVDDLSGEELMLIAMVNC
jgi:2-polyprenyl-3-methyl-5-hydroxy-6-metoxy-1,4-benzoquinol methylase